MGKGGPEAEQSAITPLIKHDQLLPPPPTAAMTPVWVFDADLARLECSASN